MCMCRSEFSSCSSRFACAFLSSTFLSSSLCHLVLFVFFLGFHEPVRNLGFFLYPVTYEHVPSDRHLRLSLSLPQTMFRNHAYPTKKDRFQSIGTHVRVWCTLNCVCVAQQITIKGACVAHVFSFRSFLQTWPKRKWPRSSPTTAVACARLVLRETVHIALCSLRLSAGPRCQASWSVWTRRAVMSVTRRRASAACWDDMENLLSGGTTMFLGIGERMDERIDGVGSIHDEDQGGCSTREKVLGMDWRIDLVFPRHVPADVDLEGRVRCIWPQHRPQDVILSSPCWRSAFRNSSVVWRLIQSLRLTGFRRGEICSQHLFYSKETSFASVSDRPADRQAGAQLPYTRNFPRQLPSGPKES